MDRANASPNPGIAERWRESFIQIVKDHDSGLSLKAAAIEGRLGAWTSALTSAVVASCHNLQWHASAKGHRLEMLPVSGYEYLGLDVMALPQAESRWRFPVAVFELENSRSDDRVAYSLWKVLCVRAELRVVFCYRQSEAQGSALIGTLREQVVNALGLSLRAKMDGEALVVVGSRNDAALFPYGFFKWWRLEKNTGAFELF